MEDRRVVWLLVTIHLLAATYGFFLNDESDQISAFHNLSRGSLLIVEEPPSAYQLADNISALSRWEDNRPIASTPLNLLALAVLPLVKAIAAMAPLPFWFSGLAAVAAWLAMGGRTPWESPMRRSAAVALLALWLGLGAGFRDQGPDLAYYGAAVALNVTSLGLGILGAVLAWHALGKHASAAWRPLLLAALIAGPWLFWARLAKYHVLSAVIVLAIVLVLQRPRRRSGDAIIGILAGLAFWTNFGVGVVVILGLATLSALRVVGARGRRLPELKAAGALLLGGLVGLAPVMAENTYLFGNPFINSYFASEQTSTGIGQTVSASNGTSENIIVSTWNALPGIAARLLHWNGPLDLVLNLLSIFTLGTRLEGTSFGIFLISPLLAVSLFGTIRLLQGPRSPPDAVWAALVLVWQAVLGTNSGIRHGAGFDARLWFHILPVLAVLAAFGVHSISQQTKPIKIIAGALAMATAPFLVLKAIGELGYRFPDPAILLRLTMQGTFVIVGLAAALIFAWSLMRAPGHAGRRTLAVALAGAIAMPIVWTGLFVLGVPTSLPDSDSHEGAQNYVPLMTHVNAWLIDAILPPTKKPLVWDGNGTLIFHPDFGSCLAVPNPCPDVSMPDILRQKLENMTAGYESNHT